MNKKVIKYSTKAPEKKDNRVLRFVGSDQGIDRDNERIITDGWKLVNYKKNPVVLINHQPMALPVAKTKRVWVDDKKLMFDIQFPESDVSSVGDSLYKLYKNGYMTSTSVGFKPNYDKIVYGDGKKTPRTTFHEQELLEISLVSIPSNPRALLTSKSMKKAIKTNVIDDLELKDLELWLDSILGEEEIENETKSEETDQDIENETEQINKAEIETVDSKSFLKYAEANLDELKSVYDKLIDKGIDLDKTDSNYLDSFFEDIDEPRANIKSDSEENPYIEELLQILKDK